MVPVLTTLRLISWQPRIVFVYCEVDHVSMAPGSILKKQLAAEAARQPELIKAMGSWMGRANRVLAAPRGSMPRGPQGG